MIDYRWFKRFINKYKTNNRINRLRVKRWAKFYEHSYLKRNCELELYVLTLNPSYSSSVYIPLYSSSFYILKTKIGKNILN